MTHQNLSLGTSWKLLQATLNQKYFIQIYLLKSEGHRARLTL